jgi:2-C-methyl-D-erythritol 4-phosphate cytidylyltransferase
LDDIIVVHDGVRPFITPEIIGENIKTAKEYGNAMTSIRSTDTLISSTDGKSSESAMERDSTFTVQTPQTYRLDRGLGLYRQAYQAGRVNTINCCELFIEMGEKVFIVNGRKTNIKLTTTDDIAYLKALHMIFHEHAGEDEFAGC